MTKRTPVTLDHQEPSPKKRGRPATKTAPAVQQQTAVAISNPYQLMQQAITSGAAVDTLEKLMALQLRYEASQAKKLFSEAMAKFAAMKPQLKKTKGVSYEGRNNTKTEYKFAPLPEIEAALKKPLADCGLYYTFRHYQNGPKIGVSCIVSHVAGHSETTSLESEPDGSGGKNSIQGIGSANSYLMRYTLLPALGLTTGDEDDDGKAANEFPLDRILLHNKVLQSNLARVLAIKNALLVPDYFEAAKQLDEMGSAAVQALGLASSKGGIFTTNEVAAFKSDAFAQKRADYYAWKETQQENN